MIKIEILEFQTKSIRTMDHGATEEQQISMMAMGLSGEVGEVIDILKKHLYHGKELDVDHLAEELGDVMFYLTNLATIFDLPMEDVLQENVEKLEKRYPQGFKKLDDR